MEEEIIKLTEKLLEYNKQFSSIYLEARENGMKQDFLEVIKPFAEEVKRVNSEWKDIMIAWFKANDRKHIHVQQVHTTADHIDQLSIQSFFPETSKSRFLNSNRTVEFFLLEVVKEMQK